MKNTRLTIDNKDLYRRYQGIKKDVIMKNVIVLNIMVAEE